MSTPDDAVAAPSSPAEGSTPVVLRLLTAFGKFWWDFLVGDTPELFVGTVLAVALTAVLAHQHVARFVVVGILPVLVVAMLVLTTYRGRGRS